MMSAVQFKSSEETALWKDRLVRRLGVNVKNFKEFFYRSVAKVCEMI